MEQIGSLGSRCETLHFLFGSTVYNISFDIIKGSIRRHMCCRKKYRKYTVVKFEHLGHANKNGDR